ncbi:MAG: hypothetical protein IT452_10970 [Planctomycetia bacterium]|nr:hypothetical protein [Planctomycetia bacterium]
MAKRGSGRTEPEMLLAHGRKQVVVGSRERILALLGERAAAGTLGKARVYRLIPVEIRTRIEIAGLDGAPPRRGPGRPKGSKNTKRGPGRPKGAKNKKRGPGRPKGSKNRRKRGGAR